MGLERTRGSTLVIGTPAARGGPRLAVSTTDIDIASAQGMGLIMWLDGQSVRRGGDTIDLSDRAGGKRATAENGVYLAPSTSGRDDRVLRWPAAADNARIVISDFALPESYWAMAIVAPTDGPGTTRALLYSSGAGTLAESWLQQSTPGAALDFRVRNGGQGGIARTQAVPHTVRSLLWWGYSAPDDRYVAGINRSLLGQTANQGFAHLPVAGLTFGGRSGTGLPTQHQVGDVEMVMIGSGPIWSPTADAAVNGARQDMIGLISDRYGLGLPSA